MTQTIEQLTARVAELKAENARLKSLATTKGAMGLLADQLKQLAAAQEDANGWKVVADNHLECITSLEDQLATAEQRVAEDCSKWIDGYSGIHQKEMLSDAANSFADALRRGEWRKFMKGE